jgi:hypothetical protein
MTYKVAKIFHINDENGREIRHRARTKRKEAHRSATLEVEQEAGAVRYIQECFEV